MGIKQQLAICYCLEWHLNVSSAIYDVLVEGLNGYLDCRLDLLSNKEEMLLQTGKVTQIFYYKPPPDELLDNPRARIVWMPLWEQNNYPQDWWNQLPKTLRVVAFSDMISQKSIAAGLPTLQARYYKNPNGFLPCRNDGARTLFYWNRDGIVGPKFLEKFCKTLDIDLLLFRDELGPAKKAFRYTVPSQIGSTRVETVPFSSREVYLQALNRANIFIAPRLTEGIGITMLEAMAQGSAVFAYNGPTMNEYIVHGQTGYLMPFTKGSMFLLKVRRRLAFELSARLDFLKQILQEYPITTNQHWKEIASLDLVKLGQNARLAQQKGYAQWVETIPDLTAFITEW